MFDSRNRYLWEQHNGMKKNEIYELRKTLENLTDMYKATLIKQVLNGMIFIMY